MFAGLFDVNKVSTQVDLALRVFTLLYAPSVLVWFKLAIT